jgi:hypothetical protein
LKELALLHSPKSLLPPCCSSATTHSSTCGLTLLLLLLLLLRQARLKELAQDLLGPERWRPAWGDASPWAPTVMGLTKRRLLGGTLLPAMAQHNLSIAGQVGLGCAWVVQERRCEWSQWRAEPQPRSCLNCSRLRITGSKQA